MLHKVYPFYENSTTSWKSNPCQTNKNNFLTFLALIFS